MLNILITGAGSVMGQSIYRALCQSQYREQILVHFFNSDFKGAGFYFNSSDRSHSITIVNTVICPLASAANYTEFLSDYIAENKIDLLFSGTQHEIEKIADLNESLQIAAVLPPSLLKLTLDKHLTMQTLRKHRVETPFSYTLKEAVMQNIDGCVIIKPNFSSASRNVYKATGLTELKTIADLIPESEWQRYVCQEFLDGDEFTCSAYLDRYSQRKSFMVMKRELSPDGASVFGEIVYDEQINQYLQRVLTAFQAEGLKFGHLNVQLRKTNVGPRLFEINGRLSSTEAPKAHFNFNTVEAFLENIYFRKPAERLNPQTNGSFIRYYDEVYFNEDSCV